MSPLIKYHIVPCSIFVPMAKRFEKEVRSYLSDHPDAKYDPNGNTITTNKLEIKFSLGKYPFDPPGMEVRYLDGTIPADAHLNYSPQQFSLNGILQDKEQLFAIEDGKIISTYLGSIWSPQKNITDVIEHIEKFFPLL